jgi:hypothetical protein
MARALSAGVVLVITCAAPSAGGVEQEPAATAPPLSDGEARQQSLPNPTLAPREMPPLAPRIWSEPARTPPLTTWLSTADVRCLSCGGGDPPGGLMPSTNGNAPWAFQGTLHRQGNAGRLSLGVLGTRNYAGPLYGALSPEGAFAPGPLSTITPNLAIPSTQWHLTAGFERTLFTTKGGATLGIYGDVLLPLQADPAAADPLSVGPISSRAARFGVVIRW